MKTAEERALVWLTDNMEGFEQKFNGDYVVSLALLLRMHSSETWEACFEAITHCKEGSEFQAIMNVETV